MRVSCRWRSVACRRVVRGARRRLPAELRRMRLGAVAVLRGVHRRPRRAGAAVVRAVRSPGRTLGPLVLGLPPGLDHRLEVRVQVLGAGAARDPPAEVLGVALRRRRARRGDRRDRTSAGRRRHVGPARARTPRVAWLRSGQGAGSCAGVAGGSAIGCAPASRGRPAAAGPAIGRRPAGGAGRSVPALGAAGTRPGPARRRRPHDRRHGGRLRGDPPRVGRPRGRTRDGGPGVLGRPAVSLYFGRWALAWVCGCPGTFPGSRGQSQAKRPT